MLRAMDGWVRPAVEEAQADEVLDRLARGGRFSFKRLFSAKEVRHRVELVFFPCRFVRLPSELGQGDVVILVNGMTEQVFQLQPGWEFMEASPSHLPRSYPLSDEATLELVARTLLQWKLSRFANAKLEADAFRVAERVQYPYWVRLGESRRGRMSLELIDAVSGRPAALVAKQAYIEMIQRERE